MKEAPVEGREKSPLNCGRHGLLIVLVEEMGRTVKKSSIGL